MTNRKTFILFAPVRKIPGFSGFPRFLQSVVKSLTTLSAVLAFFLGLTAPAQAAGRQMVRGHIPSALSHLKSTGRLSGATTLNLAIGLPLRNAEGLKLLLGQIYDPANPRYRHYLTPEQFAAQFGPSEKDYQALIAFAKEKGLTVSATHPNRVVLDVRGAVKDIEAVFHVVLREYPHPKEARTFYAPDVEPSLDTGIPVLHVSGLDNYSLPHPMSKPRPVNQSKKVTPKTGTGSRPNGTFIGNDFRAAYVPGTTLTGAGQSVGLLQFDGYAASDIAYYEAQAGLPAITLTNVLIDGATGNPSGTGGEVEVCLDIEMVASMAPGVSKIVCFIAPNPSPWVDLLSSMASHPEIKQFSCSWGGGSPDPTAEQFFQKMAAQGQSFFNATGDSDAFTGAIEFPSDSPNITEVGGTTLTTSGAGRAWQSETVWNWGGGQGSSGGYSTYYTIPPWQQGIDMAANQGSPTLRNIPDVALTADNVYVRANGTDYDEGGTSCAAPLWAGFTALMNQQKGGVPVGFLNPALYALGKRGDYTNCFHDITTGDNFWYGSPTNFPATAGYDLCTGWGTPMGGRLIDTLTEPLQIAPETEFLFSGPVGGPFSPPILDYILTNRGTNPLEWQLAPLPSWLNAAPPSGVIMAGDSSTTVTIGVASFADSLPPGTYSGDLIFSNSNDGITQTRRVLLAIVTEPVITSQPTNQAVLEGLTAAFAVETAGNALMSYQWMKDGISLADGGAISGSTTPNLAITGTAPTDEGLYCVVASNTAGVAVSSNASLTLIPSIPVFTTNPADQTALSGESATFTVTTVGTRPQIYRWLKNGVALSDGATISGATRATLTLATVQLSDSASTFCCVAGNALGVATSQVATLTVATNYFTELFTGSNNHINDLSHTMLTFTPDGSSGFYKATRDPAPAFPSATGGIPVSLGDDKFAQVDLAGAQVSLYGVPYTSLFIGSNGYITFGSGDTTYTESLATHFNRPRISALFTDLYPPAGGAITRTQLVDRVVVTFQNISEYSPVNANSFQFELFFNGVIRLTYMSIEAKDGLTGLSRGTGVPADFTGSDLSSCAPSALTAPKGTPLWWLLQYHLTNSAPEVEELDDADKDGSLNWQEYMADTDPTNKASALAITRVTPAGDAVRIDWQGGQWAIQHIEAGEALMATDIFWKCIVTNDVLPTPITNFAIQTGMTNPALFYRIKAGR